MFISRKFVALFCILFLFGCAMFKANTVSFKNPNAYPLNVNLNGVQIACEILDTTEKSKAQFNVDLNKIGVLPVRLIVKNNSEREVEIDNTQIFGVLSDESMFNTYALHQSIDKIRHSQVGKGMAAGAATGALIGGAIGAGIGAAAGGDSSNAGAGAAIGGGIGVLEGGVSGADSIADYIHKEMWHLDWGDRVIYPGYFLNGYIFLPKADYQRIEIGVFDISENELEKAIIKLK